MAGIWGGLFFLGFLVLILLVIRWCVENDRKPLGETTSGIFAMRSARKKQQPWTLPPPRI